MEINKTTLFGIIAVLVLVIGYLVYPGSKDMNTLPTSTDSTVTTAPPSSNPLAQLAESKKAATVAPSTAPKTTASAPLFKMSGSHQCDYEQVTSKGQIKNVIYFADGKMRGEFRSTELGSEPKIMIYNGGYLYTWIEGKTAGTKERITSISQIPATVPQNLTAALAAGSGLNSVSWNCHGWFKDSSMLTPPSYVKF